MFSFTFDNLNGCGDQGQAIIELDSPSDGLQGDNMFVDLDNTCPTGTETDPQDDCEVGSSESECSEKEADLTTATCTNDGNGNITCSAMTASAIPNDLGSPGYFEGRFQGYNGNDRVAELLIRGFSNEVLSNNSCGFGFQTVGTNNDCDVTNGILNGYLDNSNGCMDSVTIVAYANDDMGQLQSDQLKVPLGNNCTPLP
jgi:hypothetical protein